LYIEWESLLLVVGDLVVDILLDMVRGDREIEFKREPYNCSDIWMHDAATYLSRENDVTCIDFGVEGLSFLSRITIDAEYLSFFGEEFS
jgi:hypothetical protein